MKIDTKNLQSYVQNIFSHILLAAEKEKIDDVIKTLDNKEDPKDRTVDVQFFFNGVEYDPEIFHKVVKEQFTLFCEKEKAKYSDLEKIVQERADILFKRRIGDLKEPSIAKLNKIKEALDSIDLELFCIP